MVNKLCPKCEINYLEEDDEICEQCRGIKREINFSVLKTGKICGSKAEEIYKLGCKNLGWNKSRLSSFKKQKRLYSDNCDSFGYGVFFISHSNLTPSNPVPDDKHVENTISSDYSNIIEKISEKDNRAQELAKSRYRIVFAKIERKFNMYEFLGVYETIVNKSSRREHVRISEFYPIK